MLHDMAALAAHAVGCAGTVPQCGCTRVCMCEGVWILKVPVCAGGIDGRPRPGVVVLCAVPPGTCVCLRFCFSRAGGPPCGAPCLACAMSVTQQPGEQPASPLSTCTDFSMRPSRPTRPSDRGCLCLHGAPCWTHAGLRSSLTSVLHPGMVSQSIVDSALHNSRL